MFHLLLESLLLEFQVQVDFATDGQSANSSWCRAPSWGPWPDPSLSSHLSDNCFVLIWVALSDKRMSVSCSAVAHRSKSCRTHNHNSLIWDSPNLEGRLPIFISPKNRVAQLNLQALGSFFVASYNLQGLQWRYSNPPPQFDHFQVIYTFSTFQ
jgi:hypothetical protein